MATTVLDATVSGPNANSYLTTDEADELFEGFDLEIMDKWDSLEEDASCQLLIQATRRIDQYKGWGPKKDVAQRLAFPRLTDKEGVIPEPVRLAVMEYVVYKLEGALEPLKRLQAEGVTSSSVLGLNASFNVDPSELPSGCRRELDKLWRAHLPKAAFPRKINGIAPSGYHDPESIFG